MAMSWTWPSGLKSLSEGKISSTKTNDDEVTATHKCDGRRIDDDEAVQPHDQNKENEMVNQEVGDKQRERNLETKSILGMWPTLYKGKKTSHVWQSRKDEILNQNVECSSSVGGKRDKKLETKSTLGKRQKSKVWEVFIKHTGEDGKIWAECTHCEKKFDGSSKKGTTHLKNHYERCRGKKHVGRGADSSTQFVSKAKSAIDLIHHTFGGTGMITDEHWNPSILNSRKIDILQVYKDEQGKLCTFLSQLSCRLSLTIQQFGRWYLFMVHYINDRWEPKRKIISIQDAIVDFPSFSQILGRLCLDWKISNNICSIVSMDDHIVTEEMNSRVGSLPFGEQLFHFDGLMDILRSFIDKVYNESGVVDGIRQCLHYVHETPLTLREFYVLFAINEASSTGKKVASQGVLARTIGFEELKTAVGLKEAFGKLERKDLDFKSINLTEEKWDEATLTYKNFKELHDLVCSWSGSKHTTPNVLFPKFCDLHMKLLQWERSENYSLGKTASAEREQFALMKEIYFTKYWGRSKLVLEISVVLDPRFKKDILQLWYKEIYGSDADEYSKKSFDDLTFVYNKYAKDLIYGDANSSTTYKMLDSMGRPRTSSQAGDIASPTSELDRYLRDDKFPPVEEFDILAWWRVNSPMYPTLARMARDFLAIPISSRKVTSDSLLGRNLEKIIDCEVLDYDIKLALVCMKTWLEIKPIE